MTKITVPDDIRKAIGDPNKSMEEVKALMMEEAKALMDEANKQAREKFINPPGFDHPEGTYDAGHLKAPDDKPIDRGDILDAAKRHTIGDRDVEYGPPHENMSNIAALWNVHIRLKYGNPIYLCAEDVAYMNMLQKLARTYSPAPAKPDTFEDMAAYAAIGGECELINQG